eukprot:8866343-Pyramimonas_sp.AAC.1
MREFNGNSSCGMLQSKSFLWGVQQESVCEERCWNSPAQCQRNANAVPTPVSYTHLRAHETGAYL